MSNFTRDDLKNWFRENHPSAQTPTQPSNEDGLLTESYGDMNDPYNPDANPGAVMQDMGAASAAANRLEDDLADAIADAVAGGVGLKEIASAIEMALFGAMMHTTGREVDYKVEITPNPVPRHRSAFQRK